MNDAPLNLRYFAERLIAFEVKGNPSPREDAPTAVTVIERMRPHLATLMGNTGFQALLSRALVQAGREIPWLAGLQVMPDGTVDGFGEPREEVTPENFAEGGEVLLARLLGLLVEFIGEVLTVRLVREVWPLLPLDDDFKKGDDHEKTN